MSQSLTQIYLHIVFWGRPPPPFRPPPRRGAPETPPPHELLDSLVEEVRGLPGPAEDVDGPHHVDRIEEGVEGGRGALAEVLRAGVPLLGPHRMGEDLPELVDIELLLADPLQHGDQLLDLLDDVPDVRRRGLWSPEE